MGHGTPVLDAWYLAGSDLGLVNPEGVADADEESFGSEQAGDHLTPGLGACSVDERVPTGVEFTGSGVDICNVELDRGMGGSEHRLATHMVRSRIRQHQRSARLPGAWFHQSRPSPCNRL